VYRRFSVATAALVLWVHATLTFLTWFNPIHFRQTHAVHHQYTTHHDLDLDVALPMDLKWYRAGLANDLPLAPRGLFATWREIRATVRQQKRDPSCFRPLQSLCPAVPG
jgi:fatty acid desaturase